MIDQIINGRYQIYGSDKHNDINFVFFAFDLFLRRKVVIKFSKKKDKLSVYYLINEFRIIHKIDSDLTIRAYELGIYKDVFYIVLEFADGITIRQMINSKNKIKNTLSKKCQILIKICEAISIIHKKAIIHRDIKPDNIFYLKNEEIKIGDFEIAVDTTNKTKQDLKLIGSIYYLSPENVNYGIVNVYNDIYALGMLAYELFFNSLPFFKKTDSIDVINKEINKKLDFNNSLLPGKIVNILRKMTSEEYFARYSSVDQIKNDLEDFLEG